MLRDHKRNNFVGNSSEGNAVSIKKEAELELSPAESKNDEYVGRTARDNR